MPKHASRRLYPHTPNTWDTRHEGCHMHLNFSDTGGPALSGLQTFALPSPPRNHPSPTSHPCPPAARTDHNLPAPRYLCKQNPKSLGVSHLCPASPQPPKLSGSRNSTPLVPLTTKHLLSPFPILPYLPQPKRSLLACDLSSATGTSRPLCGQRGWEASHLRHVPARTQNRFAGFISTRIQLH